MSRPESQRRWRERNRDKLLAYKRESYHRHKAEINARVRAKKSAYKAAHPEEARAKVRAYYQEHREHIRAKAKAWGRENSKRVSERNQKYWRERRWAAMFSRVKKLCKEQGIVCDFTPAWFRTRLAIGTCEMSGLPFDMTSKRGPNTPSIDRIDPKGPYCMANCRLILWSLNRALNDYGQDYVLAVFREIFIRRGEIRRLLAA